MDIQSCIHILAHENIRKPRGGDMWPTGCSSHTTKKVMSKYRRPRCFARLERLIRISLTNRTAYWYRMRNLLTGTYCLQHRTLSRIPIKFVYTPSWFLRVPFNFFIPPPPCHPYSLIAIWSQRGQVSCWRRKLKGERVILGRAGVAFALLEDKPKRRLTVRGWTHLHCEW